MNKSNAGAQNSIEGASKESFHGKKKSGPYKEYQPEAHNEESDRGQGHYSKISSHFDYSNLGLFFGGRPAQMKTPNENVIGKVHSKKKSNEAVSSKEGTLKHTSSKDFSNLEELYENTTIINNPSETKPHTKKKSNEITLAKNSSEDSNDISQNAFLENVLFKNTNKKKSSFSSLMKTQKEDRIDQEIAEDISKLGLDNADEQEKYESNSSLKDLKVNKTNLKVLERIKSKALPNRHSLNPNITSETPKFESRTNNNSIFAGSNVSKLTKAINLFPMNYQDPDLDEDTHEQEKFINDLFEGSKKNNNSDEIPLDKSKEISQDDLNPRLLTEKTANKNIKKSSDLTLDSSRDNRKKPNLSLISADSTVDSENLLAQDHQNNSFSTPFSGASGSFNNSGKLDFSSPLRVDSGRINSENSEVLYLKNYSMQKNMNLVNSRIPIMPPLQRIPVNLNQSCMNFHGGYGSGNSSDRSTNLSFSEEYLNSAFTSSFNTPRQQQPFHNQSFNVPSTPNMMEQFFIAPQSLDPNYRSGGNFNMMNQNMNQPHSTQNSSNQNRPSLQQTGKSNNSGNNDGKNTSRMRRKTHEAEEGNQYDIDINKIDATGRTTLMIRNIPNKYDLTLILTTINANHKGKFDFFYLPIDFSNRCNFGYAFINFTHTKFIKDFYLEFNGKKWEKFNSEKIGEIKYARIQGHSALMQHFQYSRVMNQQDKKLRPYIPATPKYGIPNKQKIEELVRQQKLESYKDVKDSDYKRQYYKQQ